jgi:hypothetical protein
MRYIYTGPTSGVTLHDKTEVMLYDGREVDLPEDNAYVRTLVARKHLAPMNGSEAKTETKPVRLRRYNKEGQA